MRLAPVIFVFLWATGFVGAKYGMQDAEPFTFLAIRFVITVLVLSPFVVPLVLKETAPGSQLIHAFLVGCLVHGVYLGSVFFAIDRGVPAGISSLVVALQPFMTAVIAWRILGDSFSWNKTFFFLLALVGVSIVLFPEFDVKTAIPGITGVTLGACLLGPFAISLGSVYQKRYVTEFCLLYTSPSPRDKRQSRMPSSA